MSQKKNLMNFTFFYKEMLFHLKKLINFKIINYQEIKS